MTPFSHACMLSGLILGSLANSANAQTVLHVCHAGGPRIYAAVYETYQGLLSGYRVEGWYILENGACRREVLRSRQVRAYAFAAVNENGEFVALPFDFNLSNRGFSRSTRTLCVPVQEALESFSLASGNQSDVVAPCADGRVALATSFSILAGDVHQPIRMNARVPENLPPPDPHYARIWDERYGATAARRAEEERERQREEAERERRRQQQLAEERAVQEARGAERRQEREQREALAAAAEDLRALALAGAAPEEAVIALFFGDQGGCGDLRVARERFDAMSEAEISEICGLPDSVDLSELRAVVASARVSAWDPTRIGWPALTICEPLLGYMISGWLIEMMDAGKATASCDAENLGELRALSREFLGIEERATR